MKTILSAQVELIDHSVLGFLTVLEDISTMPQMLHEQLN